MAIATPTTPIAACARAFTHTPISHAFSQLLGTLAWHIEAERDLEDVDVWDPAFRAWLTDAERRFEAVTTLISQIHRAPLARDQDLPLARMASVIDFMIGSERPGTFQRLYRLLPDAEPLLRSAGVGPVARRVDLLQHAAIVRIDELATLATYADPHDDGLAESAAGPVPDNDLSSGLIL